jgi:hypothetical protein
MYTTVTTTTSHKRAKNEPLPREKDNASSPFIYVVGSAYPEVVHFVQLAGGRAVGGVYYMLGAAVGHCIR